MGMTLNRRLRVGDDRGSVSVWLALASFVMIVLVGLAVDLAGQVHAQQHARDVAAQAARVGGEQVVGASAVRGLGATIDTARAASAARSYLATSGVEGSVRIVNGTTLQVNTTDVYQAKFLSIIGISRMPVTGQAEARLVRVVQGTER